MSESRKHRGRTGRTLRHPRGRRRRWTDDVADAGCCCIVGEVFAGPDCFVATAAHDGDASAEPVRVLRAYRDQRLARHRAGRWFIGTYYRYGRYGARFLRRYPRLKPLVRALLTPLVAYARRQLL